MTSDIDPHSRFRLPLLKREDLNEIGQRHYDETADSGRSLAGLHGPAGIWLYSQGAIPSLRGLHQYLRYDAGLSPAIREIGILVVAREMDCQFQWAMHEGAALKAGVTQDVIDIIKHRRSTEGAGETEAAVIDLGRQAFGDHKVTSEVFARAKAVFGPHRLIDLMLLMGNAAASSALLNAVDMQLPAGISPSLPIP